MGGRASAGYGYGGRPGPRAESHARERTTASLADSRLERPEYGAHLGPEGQRLLYHPAASFELLPEPESGRLHGLTLPEIDALAQLYDPSVVRGTWTFNGNSNDLACQGRHPGDSVLGMERDARKRIGGGLVFQLLDGVRTSTDVGFSYSRRVLCVRRAGE